MQEAGRLEAFPSSGGGCCYQFDLFVITVVGWAGSGGGGCGGGSHFRAFRMAVSEEKKRRKDEKRKVWCGFAGTTVANDEAWIIRPEKKNEKGSLIWRIKFTP